jgi:hypothetical protein
MSRVAFELDDLQSAALVAQAAGLLEVGEPFVLAFDGFIVKLLTEEHARAGFIGAVVLDCITPGAGLP